MFFENKGQESLVLVKQGNMFNYPCLMLTCVLYLRFKFFWTTYICVCLFEMHFSSSHRVLTTQVCYCSWKCYFVFSWTFIFNIDMVHDCSIWKGSKNVFDNRISSLACRLDGLSLFLWRGSCPFTTFFIRLSITSRNFQVLSVKFCLLCWLFGSHIIT